MVERQRPLSQTARPLLSQIHLHIHPRHTRRKVHCPATHPPWTEKSLSSSVRVHDRAAHCRSGPALLLACSLDDTPSSEASYAKKPHRDRDVQLPAWSATYGYKFLGRY